MAINWQKLASFLPEVSKPLKKKLGFNEKLKWTGIVLLLYFTLLHIPLYGLGQNSLEQFEALSTILGASFGSLISLGIGPIVTASIVLQLLVGSGILNMDMTKPSDRAKFQAMQRITQIGFVTLEAIIYVFMGGLAPDPALIGTTSYLPLQLALAFQLFIGGYMILLMDELVQKWGFGSGIGIFIAAGVSRQIFITALSPLSSPTNPGIPVGRIPFLLQALQTGDPIGALVAVIAIVATIVVFMMAVYGQAMKVEIPLSFGRVRGYGIRWPLKFIYTSNIPVILIAALLANLQLWARLLQNWGYPILGTFVNGSPASGIVRWVNSPNIINSLVVGSATSEVITQAVVYTTIMVVGSVFFSIMWVKTSNMGADAQAKQILASGLQIPGFRRDPRVLESILNRYIPALTVMGGATVGFLAAFADLSGALSRGTGILLTVMIIYKLYEDIAKQHAYDMHPALRKFMSPE
ncbi:preprotein translocase subunit SecY [Candidatus Woesearchaeota archaeon]|jgi:preprotein translocase subunit SecY|nr:preprotein translocase subunit SecY [Candidatus Woesearchaeota archaeon]MBT4248144.1 preprotein translocase subunit SecY [Candidatus Woesearchaeota archaeon]